MKRIIWIALLAVVSVNVFAADVTLDLHASGNNQNLTLTGKTNLPPKTVLMATVVNPINQGGDGYVGQASAAVQANELVQFGPFSKDGGRLSPGTYKVTVISSMAAIQPEEVQPFFGAHGEKLKGRLVSTLPGTSERLVSQTFQFTINPDSSISNPPPDEHTIGSADEKWQKVESDDGRQIYVMTNGSYNQPGCCSAKMFHTYLVANLPNNDIVGAPQSVMTDVEGDCETRQYHVLGTLFFAGKNRSGMAMEHTEPEGFERKLSPGSPFEKAFGLLCEIAREQK